MTQQHITQGRRALARVLDTDAIAIGTRADGERWLTDRYTVVRAYSTTDPSTRFGTDDIPDGWYTMTITKGYVPTVPVSPNLRLSADDIDMRVAKFEEITDWQPLEATRWAYRADSGHDDAALFWVYRIAETDDMVTVTDRCDRAWRPAAHDGRCDHPRYRFEVECSTGKYYVRVMAVFTSSYVTRENGKLESRTSERSDVVAYFKARGPEQLRRASEFRPEFGGRSRDAVPVPPPTV